MLFQPKRQCERATLERPNKASSALRRNAVPLQVVTLDDRLADAMRKEGFALVDIAAE